MKKKTVLTLIVIAFALSFFVTPLGDYSKLLLNRVFATSPTIIQEGNRGRVLDYNWRLKNKNWEFFNFERSKGRVVFISFWYSWHLPSRAQLADIQNLYDRFKGKVDFYIITNEDREPVEEFMEKNEYTFPVTYQIIGEKSPLELLKPPGSYILDKKGNIVVHQNAISDWDNTIVTTLILELLNR